MDSFQFGVLILFHVFEDCDVVALLKRTHRLFEFTIVGQLHTIAVNEILVAIGSINIVQNLFGAIGFVVLQSTEQYPELIYLIRDVEQLLCAETVMLNS